MKLNPTTLLILAMFGSFALILGTMVAIFRPDSKPIHRRSVVRVISPKESLQQSKQAPPDTQAASKPQKTEAKTTLAAQQTETQTPSATSSKPKTPKQTPVLPPGAAASRQLYHDLQREQKEMAQLKADMQRRLKEALIEHDRKLAQLARRCEPLEPGEAV